jgi:thiol-disulfide isomerase/thioredoxin
LGLALLVWRYSDTKRRGRVRYISKALVMSVILCLYAQEIEVCGQLGEVPSTREEFGKANALRFEFTDITKTKYKLKELSGKVVLLDCWATWCKPCQKSLPELADIKTKYNEKVVILGISFDKSLDAVKKYLQNTDVGRSINYPIVFRPHLSEPLNEVTVLPTSFLIDKEGYLRCRYGGYAPRVQLETDIEKLLAENLITADQDAASRVHIKELSFESDSK